MWGEIPEGIPPHSYSKSIRQKILLNYVSYASLLFSAVFPV